MHFYLFLEGDDIFKERQFTATNHVSAVYAKLWSNYMANIQAPLPPSSVSVREKEVEQGGQETCMYGQGALGKI